MSVFFKFLNWLEKYFWQYLVATTLITVLAFANAVLTQVPSTADIALAIFVLANAILFVIFISFYGRKHLKEKEG